MLIRIKEKLTVRYKWKAAFWETAPMKTPKSSMEPPLRKHSGNFIPIINKRYDEKDLKPDILNMITANTLQA